MTYITIILGSFLLSGYLGRYEKEGVTFFMKY